ncbi:MAG: 4Fe-4S binding protein, partial [Candidatus Dasytiphilus stammeri]
MPLIITQKCIQCDICVPECPSNAISMSKDFYTINI